jgi:hypothetical protein
MKMFYFLRIFDYLLCIWFEWPIQSSNRFKRKKKTNYCWLISLKWIKDIEAIAEKKYWRISRDEKGSWDCLSLIKMIVSWDCTSAIYLEDLKNWIKEKPFNILKKDVAMWSLFPTVCVEEVLYWGRPRLWGDQLSE